MALFVWVAKDYLWNKTIKNQCPRETDRLSLNVKAQMVVGPLLCFRLFPPMSVNQYHENAQNLKLQLHFWVIFLKHAAHEESQHSRNRERKTKKEGGAARLLRDQKRNESLSR